MAVIVLVASMLLLQSNEDGILPHILTVLCVRNTITL